ncbi:hypothetical protein BDP27DRAFT_1357192 [Rhodocollybia butyracea]|uniref:Uncharacterized protein n=1 Tax=Rhodocollybia butyracea TaxID=206335 RepID=A0A9P5Q471_9AGAR|nr:hypothetical protein BDP27DRAFT_1357192 [Rhodocollybia butyracea]
MVCIWTDTRASHLHEVEFSSDDDSYEFDHLEYPQDDENIEITSARFSVGTGYISNGYGLPGRYRDREGSIATLKTLRRAISNSLVDTNGQPSMFTSPFESSSPVTETVLAAAPTSSTSPTDATDTDFDLAYITSFGADISPDEICHLHLRSEQRPVSYPTQKLTRKLSVPFLVHWPSTLNCNSSIGISAFGKTLRSSNREAREKIHSWWSKDHRQYREWRSHYPCR